jgi:hypothetical protein
MSPLDNIQKYIQYSGNTPEQKNCPFGWSFLPGLIHRMASCGGFKDTNTARALLPAPRHSQGKWP